MTSLIFFIFTFVFAGLAYDSLKLAVSTEDAPFAVTAKELGLPHEGVPLIEIERRKLWNSRYGFGDLNQIFWLWTILSVACALGFVMGFL